MEIERIPVEGGTSLRLTLTPEEIEAGTAERVIDLREGWLPTGHSLVRVQIRSQLDAEP